MTRLYLIAILLIRTAVSRMVTALISIDATPPTAGSERRDAIPAQSRVVVGMPLIVTTPIIATKSRMAITGVTMCIILLFKLL